MSEQYSTEDRIRKLQKLRTLADHPGTEAPLAKAARAQYEALVKRWEIDPEALAAEEEKNWTLKVHSGCWDLYVHIFRHLELECYYTYKGNSRRKSKTAVEVKATESEIRLAKVLLANVILTRKNRLKEVWKKAKLELNSYMTGLMLGSFPTGPCKCPKCEEVEAPVGRFLYHPSERRMMCAACGYQSKKFKDKRVDKEALRAGQMDGVKQRPDTLLEAKTA